MHEHTHRDRQLCNNLRVAKLSCTIMYESMLFISMLCHSEITMVDGDAFRNVLNPVTFLHIVIK